MDAPRRADAPGVAAIGGVGLSGAVHRQLARAHRIRPSLVLCLVRRPPVPAARDGPGRGRAVRAVQEARDFEPATVSRRMAVVTGFYRHVRDRRGFGALARRVRAPIGGGQRVPTLGLSHLQFEALLAAAEASVVRLPRMHPPPPHLHSRRLPGIWHLTEHTVLPSCVRSPAAQGGLPEQHCAGGPRVRTLPSPLRRLSPLRVTEQGEIGVELGRAGEKVAATHG